MCSFAGELNRECTADDLVEYFKVTLLANGGDANADVDALTEPGAVTLKATGVLYIKTVPCALSGNGRVAVTSEYAADVTSVSLLETSPSDDLAE